MGIPQEILNAVNYIKNLSFFYLNLSRFFTFSDIIIRKQIKWLTSVPVFPKATTARMVILPTPNSFHDEML